MVYMDIHVMTEYATCGDRNIMLSFNFQNPFVNMYMSSNKRSTYDYTIFVMFYFT